MNDNMWRTFASLKIVFKNFITFLAVPRTHGFAWNANTIMNGAVYDEWFPA